MTMQEAILAIQNAIHFLEASGYTAGGAVHDDLVEALATVVKSVTQKRAKKEGK